LLIYIRTTVIYLHYEPRIFSILKIHYIFNNNANMNVYIYIFLVILNMNSKVKISDILMHIYLALFKKKKTYYIHILK
jgi:hypothetical protein